ncbi:MAG TPA: hypothetical protein VF054_10365 [Micromonosporaceae bacterium]
MIIRILGEGQYDLPDTEIDQLNELDAELQAAVDDGDDARFTTALGNLLTAVRQAGDPVPDDVLAASDLVLPADGTDLTEVAELLTDEGLIPG